MPFTNSSAQDSSDSPSFKWIKNNTGTVPGMIKPIVGSRNLSTFKKSSTKKFSDFQSESADAWNAEEDDHFKFQVLNYNRSPVSSYSRASCRRTSSGSSQNAKNADHIPKSKANGNSINPQKKPLSKALSDRDLQRSCQFEKILGDSNVDLEKLKKLSWSGITECHRPDAWRLLSGYVPANRERRNVTLQRKREEYWGFVSQYFDTRHEELYKPIFHQIHIDVPRTNPSVMIFQQPIVREMFERILYVWAIRHPASGYVQGINDLVTPFFLVFLSAFSEDVFNVDCALLSKEELNQVEADSFWCTSKLLDSIQDNYTFAQPGIQRKISSLRDIVSRIDAPLDAHLKKHEVEYLQFSFRWMNCLLMREVPVKCIIRVWDTYLSEGDGFSVLHLYVCAAFLVRWSKELLSKNDFQSIILFIQNLDTSQWSDKDIEMLLAEAWKWKSHFNDAPSHFN